LEKWDADQEAKAQAAAVGQGPKLRGRHATAAKAKEAAAAAAAAADAEAADRAAAAGPDAETDPAAAAADTADAAADIAAGDNDQGLGEFDEDEGDDMEGFGYGIMEDPAPFVILQLKDTAETRAIWPHKFELYYKVGVWGVWVGGGVSRVNIRHVCLGRGGGLGLGLRNGRKGGGHTSLSSTTRCVG
jgi:hypothetical protein